MQFLIEELFEGQYYYAKLIQPEHKIIRVRTKADGINSHAFIKSGEKYVLEFDAVGKLDIGGTYEVTGSWIDFFKIGCYHLCLTIAKKISEP